MRAGGHTLTLLGAPRIYLILRSLATGTKGRLNLRRDAGAPAETTLRAHLRSLEETGAMVKHRRDSFPGTLEYDLTDAGRELLAVAAGLGEWLAEAPMGPLELGSDHAKAAIKGLVDSWTATVLTALAAEPLSLTELDKRISTISYPAIERCLKTMRLAEQLNAGTRGNRGTPYAVTDWLRRGLGPLARGARWEHCHQPEGVQPITRDDIDDALKLGGPLFELPAQMSGVCQLAVTMRVPDRKNEPVNLGFIEVQRGNVEFGAVYPKVEKPDAWASGTADTWFSTVIDADTDGLELSGDCDLAQTILDRLHQGLFGGEAGGISGIAEISRAQSQG